jgi:hypothetical protein
LRAAARHVIAPEAQGHSRRSRALHSRGSPARSSLRRAAARRREGRACRVRKRVGCRLRFRDGRDKRDPPAFRQFCIARQRATNQLSNSPTDH